MAGRPGNPEKQNVKIFRKFLGINELFARQNNQFACAIQMVIIESVMKAKSSLSPRLASLATGLLIAGSPAAHSQGVVTVNYGGTVSELWGSGNGVANGSVVTGTITYNPSQMAWSSAIDEYVDPYATITETINGTTTTFTGLGAFDSVNSPDSHGNLSDDLFFSWGLNNNDALAITDPVGTISGGDTVANIQTLVNLGLTEAVNYAGGPYYDNSFAVGSDASGANYGGGTLTTFNVVTTPEPSSVALATLGGAGLLALNRVRAGLNRRKDQQKTAIGFNSAM